jgi:tetratricopeptide (TPR) repeat protein
VAIGLSCFLRVSAVGDEPKKAPPTKEQIAQWIRDLEDDNFEKRQEATKRLWEAGKAAEAALREAAKSPDPEVSRRSREVLDKFKWGIFPDTPEKLIGLIRQYQAAGQGPPRLEAVRNLLDEGPAGCGTLARILQSEENVAARQEVLKDLEKEIGRALPQAFVEDKYSDLDDLFDACLLTAPDQHIHNYAAFCLVSGRLNDRIKYYRDQLGKDTKLPADKILAHLLRVNGDFAEAVKVAGKDEKLQVRILYQQRNWKELAKRKLTEPADESSRLILQSAFNRVGGNADEGNRILDDLVKKADADDPTRSRMLRTRLTRALFLSDRTKEAMTSLANDSDVSFLTALLMAQLRYADAAKLLDDSIDKQKTPNDRVRLELLRARLHMQVGEKDKATKIYERLAEDIKPYADPAQRPNWLPDIVSAEVRAGLKDLAKDHCLKLLALPLDRRTEQRLLTDFFGEQSEVAFAWWNVLRGERREKVDAEAKWKQLRSIMDGKDENLPKLLEELEGVITEGFTDKDRQEVYFAMAHACQVAGQKKETQTYLEKACAKSGPASRPHVKLGDFLAAQEMWLQAADAYRQAAEHDRADPLPLYLQGWALTKAGKADQGKKLMELSHWVPLANDAARFQFEQELTRRHFGKDARHERELVLRIDDSASPYTSIALEREANEALAKKDYGTAADYLQASGLRVFEPGTIFVDPSGYFLQPHRVHRYRARSLLDQSKIDEALKEADYCLENFAGDIELPILLIPGLEKQDRKKVAERIYTKVHDTIAKVCEQYPQSSWGHNSFGWLCAVCRRDLDEGLKHAERANELSPDNSGYLDTLAEIYFQLGKKDKALELMRKCVELEAKRSYFRRQLKRIENGDPQVPVELEVRVGEGDE